MTKLVISVDFMRQTNPKKKYCFCHLAPVVPKGCPWHSVTLQQGRMRHEAGKAKDGTEPLFVVQNCASKY
jgi:hypothetical protein